MRRLKFLQLSRFFLEDHFLQALLPLHSLRHLILHGHTVQQMPASLLYGLLSSSECPEEALSLHTLCVEDASPELLERLQTEEIRLFSSMDSAT